MKCSEKFVHTKSNFLVSSDHKGKQMGMSPDRRVMVGKVCNVVRYLTTIYHMLK